MWSWKVLHVELCQAILCQAHRLIKKPAETGWVYIVIPQQHMWTAFTQWFTPEVHLTLSSLGRQECNLSGWICVTHVVMGIHCETNVKASTKLHTCFIYNGDGALKPFSYAKKQHIIWGPQISNAWLQLRAAPWKCRTALSLHLPSQKQIVRGHPLIYVWAWSPGMWE